MSEQMIMQYVRDGGRRKLGVVVAVKYDDNHYSIGYSIVRKENGILADEFNSDLGVKMAIGRARNPRVQKIIPARVKRAMTRINERAQAYFKGLSLFVPEVKTAE